MLVRSHWIAGLLLVAISPLYCQVTFDAASDRRRMVEEASPQFEQSGLVPHVEGTANTIIVLASNKPLARGFLQAYFSDEQAARTWWSMGFMANRIEGPGQRPWIRFLTSKGFSETEDRSVAERALQNKYVLSSELAIHFKGLSVGDFLAGEHPEVLSLKYPDASNEFVQTLCSPAFAKQLSAYGFSILLITDGKDGHWGGKILPTGFGKIETPGGKSIEGQRDSPTAPSNGPESDTTGQDNHRSKSSSTQNLPDVRDRFAKALTEESAKVGNHFVYSVCSKRSMRDELCIIDTNAPMDAYAARLQGDLQEAQVLYSIGFRSLQISSGKNESWEFSIEPSGFLPMQNNSSNRKTQ